MTRTTRILALALACGLAGTLGACAGSKAQTKETQASRTPPDEPWRKERPPSGPTPEVKLPAYQKAVLENGLTVLLAEEHSLPIVDVRVVTLAGSSHEGPEEAGLAALTYDMLDEGAGEYNALTLADAFAKLGTRLEVQSGREAGIVGLGVLKRNADEALRLLSLVVQKPTFGNDDFGRVKERHLSGLKQRLGQPDAVAADVFSLLAYGKRHPYGTPHPGTPDTVEKLTARRAKRFWSEHVGPATTAVIFAGDLTLDEAKALAEEHFGQWKARVRHPKPPADPEARKGLLISLIDFPGTPQTVVRIGRPVVKKGDPDEHAFEVFNQILGGMFSSRLNMNLREDKAWTYGAFSGVEPRRALGPVVAGANIQSEHTAAALKEFFAEFQKLRAETVTEEELRAAKDNFIKSLPGKFETVGGMTSAAVPLFVYELPLDDYATLPERIEAVTADDVRRVAERALVDDQMVVVLVGDASKIEAEVKALGLGEVVRFSPDGTPLGG